MKMSWRDRAGALLVSAALQVMEPDTRGEFLEALAEGTEVTLAKLRAEQLGHGV